VGIYIGAEDEFLQFFWGESGCKGIVGLGNGIILSIGGRQSKATYQQQKAVMNKNLHTRLFGFIIKYIGYL
jgi:hypothetical protein